MRKEKTIPPKIIEDGRGWTFHEWKLPKGMRLRKTIPPWRKNATEGYMWEVIDPSSCRGQQGWAVAPNFFEILMKLAIRPRK